MPISLEEAVARGDITPGTYRLLKKISKYAVRKPTEEELKREKRREKRRKIKETVETTAIGCFWIIVISIVIWSFTDPDHFQKIVEPIAMVIGGIGIFCAAFPILALPYYIIWSIVSNGRHNAFIRFIATAIIGTVIWIIIGFILYCIGSMFGIGDIDGNDMKLRPDHF